MIIFFRINTKILFIHIAYSDSETVALPGQWDAKDIACVCSVHFTLGFIVTVTRVTIDQVGLVSNFVRFCKINFK